MTGLGQLRWITRQLKDKDSPLHALGAFRWTDQLVQKAFKAMKEEGCLATVSTDCPYTIQTLSPWLVDNVLVHLMPHLTTKSLGLIGKAGIGKTPVLETICCVMSRYWKRKLGLPGQACFRTACDLDFFRGEVGAIDRPDALDDCDPKSLTP